MRLKIILFLIFSLSIVMTIFAEFLQSKVDKSINEEWINYLEKPINNENERMDYKRFYKKRNKKLKASNKKQKYLYDAIFGIFFILMILLFIRLNILIAN